MIVYGLALPPQMSHDPVSRAPVTHKHLAVGLWVALGLVLLLPHPKGHKVKEADLHKSYGVAMSVFGLI